LDLKILVVEDEVRITDTHPSINGGGSTFKQPWLFQIYNIVGLYFGLKGFDSRNRSVANSLNKIIYMGSDFLATHNLLTVPGYVCTERFNLLIS